MAGHGDAKPMRAEAAGPLGGSAQVPGDKSISHRALILGALAVGETRITGLLEGQDVLDTGRAMRAFGAEVVRVGSRRVAGAGRGRRWLPGAGGRHRPWQLGHRRPACHGGDGDDRHHRDLHRRRQPARATDGADHRSAGALRRRGARPARRTAADRADRCGEPDTGAVHDPGRLGAGEVGRAAGRPQRARRDRRDREGGDAGPYRADARRLRGNGTDRKHGRGPGHHPARPARTARPGHRRAARPELGRVSGGRGASGGGVGHHCCRQSG